MNPIPKYTKPDFPRGVPLNVLGGFGASSAPSGPKCLSFLCATPVKLGLWLMAFEPSVGNFEAHSCGQPQLLCPLARSAIFGSNSNVFQQQQQS